MAKLGIIGGLGPAATVRLMARIVDFTLAERDQDHIETVMISSPSIPDRTAYLLKVPGAPSFVGPMQDVARDLCDLGCDVLATPCNTAHARLGEIAAAVPQARFVSMPDALARVARWAGCRKVGILATDGALRVGVYSQALGRAGLEAGEPSALLQPVVMEVIYEQVKRGSVPSFEAIAGPCDELAAAGCDAIALACTELSLIECPQRHGGALILDAMDALALACVQACGAPVRAEEATRSFGPSPDEQGGIPCADSPAS